MIPNKESNGHYSIGNSTNETNHNGVSNHVTIIAINENHSSCCMGMSESDNVKRDVNLRYELRHFIRVMGVFGLYHTPKSWQESNPHSLYRYLHRAHRIYCVAILALLFLNGVKTVIGIWYSNGDYLALQVTLSGYWFQCAANTAIWLYICCHDQLPEIFDFWQRHCQSSRESKVFGTSIGYPCIRRRIRITLTLTVVLITFASVTSIAARFSPYESFRNDTEFMILPAFEPEIVLELNLLIAGCYASAAFFLPISFIVIMCTILSYQFSQLTRIFTKFMTDNDRFKLCLISLRRQHQYLSKALFLLDGSFSFYLAVTFGASIVIACFQMYQLVVANNFASVMATLMMIFWLSMVSLQFCFNGAMTAQVHDKVRFICLRKNCQYALH